MIRSWWRRITSSISRPRPGESTRPISGMWKTTITSRDWRASTSSRIRSCSRPSVGKAVISILWSKDIQLPEIEGAAVRQPDPEIEAGTFATICARVSASSCSSISLCPFRYRFLLIPASTYVCSCINLWSFLHPLMPIPVLAYVRTGAGFKIRFTRTS